LLASTATATGCFYKAVAKLEVPETSVYPETVKLDLVQDEALQDPPLAV